MPKRTDIKTILVIGSGPIIIGQACEFDYSGTQALKTLKEEGYRVVLVNSNPATVMTDPELSDATYIEPITPDYITKIIEIEKPDALIATLGGQTALNCALMLYHSGILERHNVKLIGASIDAIKLAEDRHLFQQKMIEIGLEVPKNRIVTSLDEIDKAIEYLGLPILVRSSFSLGGAGAGIATTKDDVIKIFNEAKTSSVCQEIMLDEALIGWKEFELEVVRDKNDNCIVVCGVENVNPLGVHTGDSVTVAPIQTLTDKEYQKMRDAAFAVLRAIGVDTGGSNVQFAVNPGTGRMVVIEMNPRVSRSSALVSKATGFPIAKIATKLAVGYSLDELRNEITEGVLPASFEPSIDYVVVKIPRFHDEKFNSQNVSLGPKMRSVGEVMAIGSNFNEALQYAICGLEIGSSGFDISYNIDNTRLKEILKRNTSDQIWAVAEALRRDFTVEEVHTLTFVDPWFLYQIKELIDLEKDIEGHPLATIDSMKLRALKRVGISDKRIALLTGAHEADVRRQRLKNNISPVYKRVDSCAGEFSTVTSYMYSTYQEHSESYPSLRKKILILGSGPNRIGQGIEFDYACVKAVQAFSKNGYETIMVNCNPETVSTDYDIADKLYFVPITLEKVLDIIELEKPEAVALQFGGQTPLNLLSDLTAANITLLGLTEQIVSITEDRDNFRNLLQKLGLKQPNNVAINSAEHVDKAISSLRFPLIIRPSFVLGGKGMEVVKNSEVLRAKVENIFSGNGEFILLEEFLKDAIEVDIDVISDGNDVFIPLLLEHIESLGVHSGDSACITPQLKLAKSMVNAIYSKVKILTQALGIKGLMNIQIAVQDDNIYVIEVNPRASRTIPFTCKATGIPLIEVAVNCMLEQTLRNQNCLESIELPYFCVKEAVIPFNKFPTSAPTLGPEMKSTGEVMGIGMSVYEAFLKAQTASGNHLPDAGVVLATGFRSDDLLIASLVRHGYTVKNTLDENLTKPNLILSVDNNVDALLYAVHNNIPYVSTYEAAETLVNSVTKYKRQFQDSVTPLQKLHAQVQHPFYTKHLLTGLELSQQDILFILELAQKLKDDPQSYSEALKGKRLALVFDKPSFRTRFSFGFAIQSLGGTFVESTSGTRKNEDSEDVIGVLNGYCDFVMIRTHEDKVFDEMLPHAKIPIINALSAMHHPCQILADLLTMKQMFKKFEGITLSYIGDGNNILHSLILLSDRVGLRLRYCCPKGYEPSQHILDKVQGSPFISKYDTPLEAATDAHAIYTDVWTSMGFEGQIDEDQFAGFQINEALMRVAKPNAIFMHCMPIDRGKEVSLSLPADPSSVIFTQSENRLHVQKAILLFLSSYRTKALKHNN
jgi:carbamoyl-phosphate synthase large subunit